MNKLFLFTATYPYRTAETFLEDEIHYLAKGFDEVIIQPLSGPSDNGFVRQVPINSKVCRPVVTSTKLQYLKLLIPTRAWITYIKEFFTKRAYVNVARLKTWLISFSLTNNLLLSKQIKDIFKNISKEDVCYFYWGKGSNTLAHFFKGKSKFISRFHGEWDLWEESSGNYAPLRELINQGLNKALFISQKGECYYQKKYPEVQTDICRLGSYDNGIGSKSSDGVLRVVSCSTIYSLKRVDLIFESMFCASDIKIEWTHLGGGRDFDKLKKLTNSKKREGLEVILKGQITHDDVINYYKKHQTDLFINLSINEGIPVSIMEAISFGIPVIATDVGASSEVVVNGKSGILVSPNPTPQEVAKAIRDIVSKKGSLTPRSFWEENYNADINYNRIVELLKTL